MSEQRESMQFDVVIVGAGPAGLSAAIHLAQLAKAQDKSLEICVLEKGPEVGAHILSGAILQPTALNELLPNWQSMNAPINTMVESEQFLYLTQTKSFKMPVPQMMHNEGNYIVSLSQVCRWLGEQAEQLGVQIFAGFAANELLINTHNEVYGVATKAHGVNKQGQHKSNYQASMELHATYTILAEGCRGSLSEQAIANYHLRRESNPQTYGLGIKELWEIPEQNHQAGSVLHTMGWPLDTQTFGGSFIYQLKPNWLAVGFVVGLDYKNPYINPFQELQRFKHHSSIAPLFEGGRRIAYGARCINEGGLQAIPKLTFPGGMLVGCSAGFVNVPKIKGSHNAMKSGMLAAKAIFEKLSEKPKELSEYNQAVRQSWIWQDLHPVRNFRPAYKWGRWFGMAYSALEAYVLGGNVPWTFKTNTDHLALYPAASFKPIHYPKPDNKISFDRLSSVALSGTMHEEDQPSHLHLESKAIPLETNLSLYDGPEGKYCPAGVYEFVQAKGEDTRLQVNAQNCLHCKACDIKDPKQNITWTTPEGGDGPKYSNM